MVKQISHEKLKTSLRFQYVVAAVVVICLLILGAIVASTYFNSVTQKNTVLLKLNNKIIIQFDDLRNAMWKADKSLYVMLSNTDKFPANKITQNFNAAVEKLKDILNVEGIEKTGLVEHLNKLISAYNELNAEVAILLDLRKDINWLYPMLPFISSTLLEPNIDFETALNQAIKETFESENKIYFVKVYDILDSLRNLWRLKILDFRGAIIRFAGLNTRNISQEKNIENYNVVIADKLKELSDMAKKGELGFETELALDVMLESSRKWHENYQKLFEIRKANIWRSDINYIRTKIQPLQKIAFYELGFLENQLNTWSSKNTQRINKAAKNLNAELWFLTFVSVLFVVVIYFKLNKNILLPIENISKEIQDDLGGSENLHLKEQSSKEINILVRAFNTMRKQIHHRQMVLEFQAMHDSLTGLPNRALLQDRLEQAIHQAARNGTKMSLLLLDLDRFKDINDTLGHPVGDVVLRKISRRLEECLRSTDTVARLGGDEFAIITNESDSKKIELFIERIVQKIEKVITIDEQRLHVGLSIGVASYPKDGLDADTLIQHADIAMYSAKRNNKTKEFYKTEKNYYDVDNLTLLADLKAELKSPSNKMNIYYQPQINLNTGEIIGFESLIRWQDPLQGSLPAEQIIRMAEKTGLISELTYFVIDKSINDYELFNMEKINLAINLSAMNLQDATLVKYIQKTLREAKVQANNITFEITESSVMNDPVRAKEILEELNEMGAELAIDDYGTGFSSLAYLKLLPVKHLKIDKSFVVNMLEDDNDAIIVHSTIELAHNLGLTVVAEGVENKATYDKLQELGCDYAQGYYISKPIPMVEIEHWYKTYIEKKSA